MPVRRISVEGVLRGIKIAARSKLEGIRLMNELADRVLTARQKAKRQKLRAAGN